jgi:acyl-CoA dehydrogenase
MLLSLLWLLLFVSLVMWLAYRRASLAQATLVLGLLLVYYTAFGAGPLWWKVALWGLYLPHVVLNIRPLRRYVISNRFLRIYRRMLPPMSNTESEALEAGTVWWDGELFTGGPDWNKLLSAKVPTLSAEEQAFIDGPCEELCRMINDWDITHRRADLPPELFDFIKKKGFWAMIIPKKYGGLEFSAYAHSSVVVKIASRSGTVASTVVVPNSLGPAELLMHYGTEQQRNHYLPRLARGDEIPCFGLTGPRAGSDAGSIPDTGVVCRGMHQGREVVGIRLNFSKR